MLERLVDAGHDVEHVDMVAVLGKGTSDTDLVAYSRDTERAIVTYDDDFIEDDIQYFSRKESILKQAL